MCGFLSGATHSGSRQATGTVYSTKGGRALPHAVDMKAACQNKGSIQSYPQHENHEGMDAFRLQFAQSKGARSLDDFTTHQMYKAWQAIGLDISEWVGESNEKCSGDEE